MSDEYKRDNDPNAYYGDDFIPKKIDWREIHDKDWTMFK